MVNPTFSVVVATYDRGALIEATLESVALQTDGDFEVLIVSDGPATEGLHSTVAQFGHRFRVLATAERCGSQFAPNSYGWSMARGRFIAYLGHDDIWLPDHLAAVRRCFERRPQSHFAASGCIFFGPPGSGSDTTWVTGLFDPDDRWMAFTHFFPPSSVAHRRELPSDVRWPDANVVLRPVDSEFQLTAARGGCVFTSTGTITVLKFNSALRYLSYLTPDDDEQRAAIALILDPAGLAATIQAALADASAAGNYMSTMHPPENDRRPGEAVRIHARVRGIDTPSIEQLTGPTWMPIGDDPRAYDWHDLERDAQRTWRWSGPNPRPRLLIPFCHDGPVRISLHLEAVATVDVLESLEVLVDRRPAATVVRRGSDSAGVVIEIETVLRGDKPSVVELRMNRTVPVDEFIPASADHRRLGVCLTGIHLAPVVDSAAPGRA